MNAPILRAVSRYVLGAGAPLPGVRGAEITGTPDDSAVTPPAAVVLDLHTPCPETGHREEFRGGWEPNLEAGA